MLRITVIDNSGPLTFRLEGRLAGPWVRELEACWREATGGRRTTGLHFDLTGVTFIDAAGKAFLAARHAEGAEFTACDCLMRALVAEIASVPGGAPHKQLEESNDDVPGCRRPHLDGVSLAVSRSRGEATASRAGHLRRTGDRPDNLGPQKEILR